MDQLLFCWRRVCECPSCSITIHRAVTATPNRSLTSACRLPVALPGLVVTALLSSGPSVGFGAGLLLGTDLMRP